MFDSFILFLSGAQTVFVSCLSPTTSDECIGIFFENKRRNGGGPIKKLLRLNEVNALVHFRNHLGWCSFRFWFYYMPPPEVQYRHWLYVHVHYLLWFILFLLKVFFVCVQSGFPWSNVLCMWSYFGVSVFVCTALDEGLCATGYRQCSSLGLTD